MTWFDLIVFGIMGLSILFAIIRGITRELVTLLALGIGAALAFWLAGPLMGILGIGRNLLAQMVIVATLLLVFFLAATTGLTLVLGRFLGDTPGKIDRSIGGIFGFLRGWLIVGLGYLALDYYFEDDNKPAALTSSLTSGFAKSAADILENLGLEAAPQTAVNPYTDETVKYAVWSNQEKLP